MYLIDPVHLFRCGHALHLGEQHALLETDVGLQFFLRQTECGPRIDRSEEEARDPPVLGNGPLYQGISPTQHRKYNFLLHGEVRQQVSVEEGAAFVQHHIVVRAGLQLAPDTPAEQQPLMMLTAQRPQQRMALQGR